MINPIPACFIATFVAWISGVIAAYFYPPEDTTVLVVVAAGFIGTLIVFLVAEVAVRD